MRLVSLLPSATGIAYALGLGEELAGVTIECDDPPPPVRSRPSVRTSWTAIASILHPDAVPAAPPAPCTG